MEEPNATFGLDILDKTVKPVGLKPFACRIKVTGDSQVHVVQHNFVQNYFLNVSYW
jgi:hypothetical protein